MKAKLGFKLPLDGSEAVESFNGRKPRLLKPRKLIKMNVSKNTTKWLLSENEIKYFHSLKQRALEEGKPMVLWGWKRDKIKDGKRHPESRTVYFSADLEHEEGNIGINRAFFFLETRAKDDEILTLQNQVRKTRKAGDNILNILTWQDLKFDGYSRFRVWVGEATVYDKLAIKRRLKGRPRINIAKPKLVPEYHSYYLKPFAPFALCIGSGLSAESGLPLLGSIHNLFEVDNMDSGELVFGAMDNLPQRIAQDLEKEFASFCEFTIQAVKALPSDSHRMLADLFKKGVVKQVFTDNMDDILSKVDVPHISTRLSIFPDRFQTLFDSTVKSLLVIGVAVDRRDVIKQARKKGLKIIAINPVMGVAPHSRNMDYLKTGDIFFKETAISALPKIIKESKL